MTQHARDRQIRAEIDRRGRVPAVRAMARALGTDPRTVRRAYRRLGVTSQAKPGRPAVEATVCHVRLSNHEYDLACQLARQRAVDVTHVLRDASALGLLAMKNGPNFRS